MSEAIYEDVDSQVDSITNISINKSNKISNNNLGFTNDEPVFPRTLEQVSDHLDTLKQLHKLLIHVTNKLNSIYNTAATEMSSLVHVANKKLNEITKPLESTSSFAMFIDIYLKEIENQSKCLKQLHDDIQSDFIKPLGEEVRERRKIWTVCLNHAQGFNQQVDKQQTYLQQCHRQCRDVVDKVDAEKQHADGSQKFVRMFNDLYNTCVLQRKCSESMNNALCTDINPHSMDNIEQNHRELNANYVHYMRNVLSLQNKAWCGMQACVGQNESNLENVNILQDLRIIVEASRKEMSER